MGEVEASLCLKESWASDCGRGSDGTCRRQLSMVGQLSVVRQLCMVVGHSVREARGNVAREEHHHQVCGVSWESLNVTLSEL